MVHLMQDFLSDFFNSPKNPRAAEFDLAGVTWLKDASKMGKIIYGVSSAIFIDSSLRVAAIFYWPGDPTWSTFFEQYFSDQFVLYSHNAVLGLVELETPLRENEFFPKYWRALDQYWTKAARALDAWKRPEYGEAKYIESYSTVFAEGEKDEEQLNPIGPWNRGGKDASYCENYGMGIVSVKSPDGLFERACGVAANHRAYEDPDCWWFNKKKVPNPQAAVYAIRSLCFWDCGVFDNMFLNLRGMVALELVKNFAIPQVFDYIVINDVAAMQVHHLCDRYIDAIDVDNRQGIPPEFADVIRRGIRYAHAQIGEGQYLVPSLFADTLEDMIP